MFIVCLALGVAAHLHAAIDLELSAAGALVLFSTLLILHVLIGRRTRAERPRGASMAAPNQRPTDARDTASPTPAAGTSTQRNAAANPPADQAPEIDPIASPWPFADDAGLPTDAPAGGEPREEEYRPRPQSAPARAAPWDFRPGGHAAPPVPGAHTPSDVPPRPEVAPAGRGAAEDESEAIDRILKRLAAQIESGTEQARRTVAELTPQNAPAGEAAQAAALANAVESLRSAAAVMRGSDGATPADAQAAEAAATTRAAPPAQERLAAAAEALAQARVDVYLEPILGLADERARHFEVTVRLRQSTGEAIDAEEMVRIGRGAELLPLLDALRVRHSAELALRLERRGRDGRVFSNITCQSLASRQFLAGIAERRGQADFVSDRLVLCFEQSEVRGLAPAQWSALGGMREQGFRFALRGLTNLDMDFAALKANGFEFVKLDARVFLQGLPLGQGAVPASDLCRYLAGVGLAVVVDRISSEAERTRILGYGVAFGQGSLFGPPRPVTLGVGAAAA